MISYRVEWIWFYSDFLQNKLRRCNNVTFPIMFQTKSKKRIDDLLYVMLHLGKESGIKLGDDTISRYLTLSRINFRDFANFRLLKTRLILCSWNQNLRITTSQNVKSFNEFEVFSYERWVFFDSRLAKLNPKKSRLT